MRIDIQSPSTIDTLHTTYLSPSSVNDFLVRIFQGPYDELYSMTWGDPTRIGRIPNPDDSVFVFEPNHFSYNPPIGGSHPVSTLSSILPLDKIEFPDFIYSNGCQHQPMNFSLDYSKVIDSLHWNFGESVSTIDLPQLFLVWLSTINLPISKFKDMRCLLTALNAAKRDEFILSII